MMSLLIAKVLVWTLYHLLPSGYSASVWRHPPRTGQHHGTGNATLHTCPSPRHKELANALWHHHDALGNSK
jgi:hypothetical protein